MKYLIMAILAICLMATGVYASDLDQVLSEPNSGTTGGANYDHKNFITNYLGHTHEIPSRENALGLGMDIEYAFTNSQSAVLEYKYDFANEEHSTYLVGKLKFGKK